MMEDGGWRMMEDGEWEPETGDLGARFLSLVPCCLGFVNPVYVFSVGYGLSVAAQGAGLWVRSETRPCLFTPQLKPQLVCLKPSTTNKKHVFPSFKP